MKLSLSTINLAARIYSHAVVAHMDCGGCQSEDEIRVVTMASRRACRCLRTMGIEPSSVASMDQCIEMAKAFSPAE